MKSRQSGFTLVEIAIVLVIIGLLLGGVLKGQELINSAKIKNLIADMNGISTAVYAYQDRYKGLPGDDSGAVGRWAANTAAALPATSVGNATLQGVFNSATVTDESRLFWQHLRLAGFIGGDPTTTQPINAVGGITGVQWGAGNQTVAALTQGLAGLVVCQSNILGRIAEAMDNQLDDGRPNSGAVRSWTQGAGLLVAADAATTAVDITAAATGSPSPATTYVDDGNTMYTVCKKVT
ncbi:prepilin-type N-terminal cleavage/methylation domain-containing protein [Sulfuritalea sp.]|uniref:prepilin-type N-terminal cleavage/methylation domain-containing protein n=1 Tax=Sulfuritalea sp. TaxID=2480090 RepID=UPI00286EA2F8|nr:prepilin-type N-terminal cleavage/methylation domain-containing protein [Sulfuritalea sp.]